MHQASSLFGSLIIFDVIYERDLSSERLAPYHAVAVLTAQTVHERALSALENFVAAGGKLLAAGDVAAYDETGRKRPRPAWFGQKAGKGECIYYDLFRLWTNWRKLC